MYGLFGHNHRAATLFAFYLSVPGIVNYNRHDYSYMLKYINQQGWQHPQVAKLFQITRKYMENESWKRAYFCTEKNQSLYIKGGENRVTIFLHFCFL